MVTRRSYLHLVSTAMVVSSLILSACSESKQTTKAQVATNNANAGRERVKLNEQELKDRINPRAQAAYKAKLAPIFAKLDADTAVKASWGSLFNLKTWILGDVNLKTTHTNSRSATKGATATDITARQSLYEIWMDKNAYNGLNEDFQAKSILTEYLTALYIFKFMSVEELNKMVKDVYPAAVCTPTSAAPARPAGIVAGEADQASTTRPAATPRRGQSNPREATRAQPGRDGRTVASRILSAEDYTKIEAAKNYIIEKGLEIKHTELVAKLVELGFDQRIFAMEIKDTAVVPAAANAATQTEEQKAAALALALPVIEKLKALNETSSVCFGVTTNEKMDCNLTVVAGEIEREVTAADGTKSKEKIASLELEAKAGEVKFLNEKWGQFVDLKLTDANLSVKFTGATNNELFLRQLISVEALKADAAVGFAYKDTYMILGKATENDAEVVRLYGLVSIPRTISVLEKDADGKVTLCKAKKVENKDLSTDVLLIASADTLRESVKKAVESIETEKVCK